MPKKKRYKSTSARIKKPSLWDQFDKSYLVRAVISVVALVFIVTIVGITAELFLARKMPIDTGSTDQTEPTTHGTARQQ